MQFVPEPAVVVVVVEMVVTDVGVRDFFRQASGKNENTGLSG